MSSMQKMKRPYDLFYCYAEKDKALLNQLETHLSALKRDGEIRSWSKQEIKPGTGWQHELDSQISRASIILLLVSSDFTHSDHVYNYEIERVVQKRQAKKAIIIPIILRPCDWEENKFGESERLSDYEVLPQNRKPVTLWPHRDEAFTEIALAVRQAVTNLREYEQERRMGIVNLHPKSIYPKPNKVIPQHIPLLEDLPPNPLHFTGQHTARASGSRRSNRTSTEAPKVSTPIQHTRRHSRADTQLTAQSAGVGIAKPSWGKKSLPKTRNFSQMRKKYFTFDDMSKYDTSIRGTLFFFFLAFDVGGLSLVSLYWQISQEQPIIALALSFLFFLWGVLNKNGLVALVLAASFSIIWVIIGFHYLPLYPPGIPITVIAAAFVLAFARFILFREYKKRRSLFSHR